MKTHTTMENMDQYNLNRKTSGFESVSIVLPVINEISSLYQTVDTVFESAPESIQEVIIVVCNKTTDKSLSACNELEKIYTGRIRIIWQKLPFLGGALREGLLAAQGSHVIVMYSDGESDPRSVADLIREARKNPEGIISASRWLKRNSFEGYPFVKTLLNYFFQKTFSLLYWRNITDFTFGYRIYPVKLIHNIFWQETGHSFVFESIIKPLRLHVNIKEVPTTWKARSEGVSQLKPSMYLRYLWIGLKIRTTKEGNLVKQKGSGSASDQYPHMEPISSGTSSPMSKT